MIDKIKVQNLVIKSSVNYDNTKIKNWKFTLNMNQVFLEFQSSKKEGNKIYLNSQLKLYDPK